MLEARHAVFSREDSTRQFVRRPTAVVPSQISKNSAQGSDVMAVSDANCRENKSSSAVYVDSNTSILLQTVNTSVSRIHHPYSSVTIHILFDSGSQWNYISERAKEKLGLFPKRKLRSCSFKRLDMKTKT